MPTPELHFIVGGGAHLTFDYRIIGGLFNGYRITLAPACRPGSLDYGRSIATDPEQWERELGYSIRPTIARLSGERDVLQREQAWEALDPETSKAVRDTLDALCRIP
jgi:hypothetical protein